MAQTAAVATDFESRRCDVSQEKNSLEQLYLTGSPSDKSTPPICLTINKRLPSYPLSPSPPRCLGAQHICEKVIISQSAAAGCHTADQPQAQKGNVREELRFRAVLSITTIFHSNIYSLVFVLCLKQQCPPLIISMKAVSDSVQLAW